MLKEYINHLTVNGKSKNTITNYIGRIKYLLKKIAKEKLTEKKLIELFLELGKKRSPSTVNGYRNAIQSYLKFLKKDIPLPTSLKTANKLPDISKRAYPCCRSDMSKCFKSKSPILFYVLYRY